MNNLNNLIISGGALVGGARAAGKNMAALSLSWCHTFAFGGILVVVCAPLLVTVGAADTNSLETAVRDAATEYLAQYGDILSGNPCDISQLISQPCGFAQQGQNFDYRVGSVPPTGDPVSI